MITADIQITPESLLKFMAIFMTVITIVYSVGALVGSVLLKQLHERIENHLKTADELQDTIQLSKFSILSIVSSEAILSAARQSYPSKISTTLALIKDHLEYGELAIPFHMSTNHRTAIKDQIRLKHVYGIAQLILGDKSLNLSLLEPNSDELAVIAESDELRRLRHVYFRHCNNLFRNDDWISELHEIANNRTDQSWVNKLVTATTLLTCARQELVLHDTDLSRTLDQLLLAKKCLSNLSFSLPAVEAYKIKISELLRSIDHQEQPDQSLSNAIAARRFFFRHAEEFITEADSGICANYLFVLAEMCEIIWVNFQKLPSNLVERIPGRYWGYIKELKAPINEDLLLAINIPHETVSYVNKVEIQAEFWSKIGNWLLDRSLECVDQVEDYRYCFLTELTDRFVLRSVFKDDLSVLRACLRTDLNKIHLLKAHKDYWQPNTNRWRASGRKVRGD